MNGVDLIQPTASELAWLAVPAVAMIVLAVVVLAMVRRRKQ